MLNIPAINNQKEALIIHLGLDEENNDLEQIEPLDDTPGLHNKRIRTFRHKTDVYQVAHVSHKIGGHAVVNFNSSNWEIRKFPSTKKKQSMENDNSTTKSQLEEQAQLLSASRLAISELLEKRPELNAMICGSTTLGNLKAHLAPYSQKH